MQRTYQLIVPLDRTMESYPDFGKLEVAMNRDAGYANWIRRVGNSLHGGQRVRITIESLPQ